MVLAVCSGEAWTSFHGLAELVRFEDRCLQEAARDLERFVSDEEYIQAVLNDLVQFRTALQRGSQKSNHRG